MGNTVYAEGMGFFHKGSGGKGVAPGDVCLSPPPPPAGPAPVPYVNMLQASDLAQGSKTVKIMGEPTALENASHVSTSTGNEAGTQGGGVVTHKTKGKGSFKLWSFVVKAEGKGICRHGDPMEQNTASPLPNCVDSAALVNFKRLTWVDTTKPCTKPYKRKDNVDRKKYKKQKAAVRGKKCWQCGKRSGRKDPKKMTPDHQPPMNVAWYLGGCHNPAKFKEWANKIKTVNPHCKSCSSNQGGRVSSLGRDAPRYKAVMAKVKAFLAGT